MRYYEYLTLREMNVSYRDRLNKDLIIIILLLTWADGHI